jgi:NTP pyrophosphatase (non-canonical NTP hydrolase)
MNSALDELARQLRHFAAERHWEPFHSPKNLAAALSVEAAELLEHFQWLTEDDSRRLPADKQEAVAHEAADVLLYLIQLTDKLDIDLIAAAERKLEINRQKYPVDSARGTSRKYTEL